MLLVSRIWFNQYNKWFYQTPQCQLKSGLQLILPIAMFFQWNISYQALQYFFKTGYLGNATYQYIRSCFHRIFFTTYLIFLFILDIWYIDEDLQISFSPMAGLHQQQHEYLISESIFVFKFVLKNNRLKWKKYFHLSLLFFNMWCKKYQIIDFMIYIF